MGPARILSPGTPMAARWTTLHPNRGKHFPIHFLQPKFLDAVNSMLSDNGLEPRYLEIELTETIVRDHAEGSIAILEELSRMGVLVSIDEFGTGYSSMSYLRRFPIDKLKIDRCFINDLTTNSDAASIVKAIISLAHSLRLKVVAGSNI
jgi:diguanylate cyclase